VQQQADSWKPEAGRWKLPLVYPIIDTAACAARGLDPVAVAHACLRGGALLLQIRQTAGTSRGFLELTDAVVAAARAHPGARVIVNDRADIAAIANADGVHVGQDDLTVADAARVLGRPALIGLSTHSRQEIDAALDSPAGYVAVGPVFHTATKETGYAARGLGLVEYAAGRGKPVVGIGGITLETAPAVIAAGAWAVAVISDLFVGGDVEARVHAYRRALPAQSSKV
jgi:thiamine-phosphate pyrophosphorylase